MLYIMLQLNEYDNFVIFNSTKLYYHHLISQYNKIQYDKCYCYW